MNKKASICAEILLTQGCHLCEDAKAAVAEFNDVMIDYNVCLVLKEVDIAEDENMVSIYGQRIPVLRFKELNQELDWPFTGEEIYQFLRQP